MDRLFLRFIGRDRALRVLHGIALWMALGFVGTQSAQACRVVCSLGSEIFILCGLGSDSHFQLLKEGQVVVDSLACELPTLPPEASAKEQEELRLINDCKNMDGARVRMHRRQTRRLAKTKNGPFPVSADELVLRIDTPEKAHQTYVFERAECGSAAER